MHTKAQMSPTHLKSMQINRVYADRKYAFRFSSKAVESAKSFNNSVCLKISNVEMYNLQGKMSKSLLHRI